MVAAPPVKRRRVEPSPLRPRLKAALRAVVGRLKPGEGIGPAAAWKRVVAAAPSEWAIPYDKDLVGQVLVELSREQDADSGSDSDSSESSSASSSSSSSSSSSGSDCESIANDQEAKPEALDARSLRRWQTSLPAGSLHQLVGFVCAAAPLTPATVAAGRAEVLGQVQQRHPALAGHFRMRSMLPSRWQSCVAEVAAAVDRVFLGGALERSSPLKVVAHLEKRGFEAGKAALGYVKRDRVHVNVRALADAFPSGASVAYETNGRVCSDPRDALCTVVEHELVHVLMMRSGVDPPTKRVHHTQAFSQVVRCLFGHTSCRHSMVASRALVTAQSVADAERLQRLHSRAKAGDPQPGDVVMIPLAGSQRYGEVTRETRGRVRYHVRFPSGETVRCSRQMLTRMQGRVSDYPLHKRDEVVPGAVVELDIPQERGQRRGERRPAMLVVKKLSRAAFKAVVSSPAAMKGREFHIPYTYPFEVRNRPVPCRA
eukprot:TRINITY_DN44_c0_g1_i1.p1 TRINITY_DN44_c0_g1~~TRINITY_DN44_c0_g1_i1.p1  ORF type:complete len:485 (+),score=141.41 TRINITY_DN44_c0_g1_i1:51-1505(+)